MQIFLVTGPVSSGKTSFLKGAIENSGKRTMLSGIISPKITGESGTGYELENIRTGEKRGFISSSSHPDWMQYGRFYFNPLVFEWGNEIIKSAGKDTILIIDEIGPVELNGGGFRTGLDHALKYHTGSLIITVRHGILENVSEIIRAEGHDSVILPPEEWTAIDTL